MTILFDFTLLENDLSFFIVKQNIHTPAKWHRKRVRKGCFEKNYEKLRAKGHFDFKTPFAHARKGLFEKKHEKLRAKGHFDFTSPFRARMKGAFTIGLKCVLTLMRSGSFCFLGENKHYFSGEMKHGHETFCTFVPQRI